MVFPQHIVGAIDDIFAPLTKRCKHRYSEAIDILYSHNTFNIQDLSIINIFTSSILPQRLRSIRVLHIAWPFREHKIDSTGEIITLPFDERWRAVWEAITAMSGLEELCVRLIRGATLDVVGESAWEERVFEPMLQMRAIAKFEVEMNWAMDPAPSGPFRLTTV